MIDLRLIVGTGLNLLYIGIVILEIHILEEDQIVIFMSINAIFAKCVCTLVACAFNLLTLMTRLLAVRDTVTGL